LLINKENCALKLVDEIILYYDARSKKHHNTKMSNFMQIRRSRTDLIHADRWMARLEDRWTADKQTDRQT